MQKFPALRAEKGTETGGDGISPKCVGRGGGGGISHGMQLMILWPWNRVNSKKNANHLFFRVPSVQTLY